MRYLALFCLLMGVVGCGGLRFANIPVNEALPEDWKNRNFYQNTVLLKYNLDELAGSILYQETKEGEYVRGSRIVDAGHEPTIKMIDNGKMYESKVDRGATVQGGYLAWTASLKENQKAGVVIQDVSLVFIPARQLPWEKLAKLAAQQKPGKATRRYYVQGVLLSTIVKTNYVAVAADASGVIGDTIGIGGRVYTRKGSMTRDFRIALELIDIDKIQARILPEPRVIPGLSRSPSCGGKGTGRKSPRMAPLPSWEL